MKRKKTCGAVTGCGYLIQYQAPPTSTGSTESREGWATDDGGLGSCVAPTDHKGVHVGYAGRVFVSWPWTDLGNGWGCWDEEHVAGDAAALWGTARPVDSLVSVVAGSTGVY